MGSCDWALLDQEIDLGKLGWLCTGDGYMRSERDGKDDLEEDRCLDFGRTVSSLSRSRERCNNGAVKGTVSSSYVRLGLFHGSLESAGVGGAARCNVLQIIGPRSTCRGKPYGDSASIEHFTC